MVCRLSTASEGRAVRAARCRHAIGPCDLDRGAPGGGATPRLVGGGCSSVFAGLRHPSDDAEVPLSLAGRVGRTVAAASWRTVVPLGGSRRHVAPKSALATATVRKHTPSLTITVSRMGMADHHDFERLEPPGAGDVPPLHALQRECVIDYSLAHGASCPQQRRRFLWAGRNAMAFSRQDLNFLHAPQHEAPACWWCGQRRAE